MTVSLDGCPYEAVRR